MEFVAFAAYLPLWWLFWAYRYPRHPGGWLQCRVRGRRVFEASCASRARLVRRIADQANEVVDDLGASPAVLSSASLVDTSEWAAASSRFQ